MNHDGLMAWLGPAAHELTSEQLERFAAEAARIDEWYPDDDEQDERDAALTAVVQHLLGETSPAEANNALLAARREERRAYAAALAVGVMLVGDGSKKATAAGMVGVDRMSLLKALGER
jgi:hypothetical protein